MFKFTRSVFGVDIPIPLLYINEIQSEQEIKNVTVTAAKATDTLDIFGVNATLRFVSESSSEFVAPFEGADFLSGLQGSLFVTITDSLPVGFHLVNFVGSVYFAGLNGMGLLGGGARWE